MWLHLVLGQVSPGQHAAVRLPCDSSVLFPREKFLLVTIPGHITSGVCFSAVMLPQGTCTQFL